MATNERKMTPKSQNGTVFRSFFKVKLVLFRLMLCAHMSILGQNEVLFGDQKWPFWMAQLNMCAKSAKNSPFLTQKTALFWSIWGNLSKRQSKMTILTFFDVFKVLLKKHVLKTAKRRCTIFSTAISDMSSKTHLFFESDFWGPISCRYKMGNPIFWTCFWFKNQVYKIILVPFTGVFFRFKSWWKGHDFDAFL